MIKGAITINLPTKDIQRKTLQEIDNALVYVGYRIVNDVDDIGPMVPIDEGTLVGSSYVSVQGENGLTNENYSSGTPTAGNITPDTSGLPKQGLRISYNTAYAQKIHEEYNKMEPGPGSVQKFGSEDSTRYGYKFLERTYLDNQDKYVKLFQEFLEEGIQRATNG